MHDFQGYFTRTFQDLKLQFPGLSRTKLIFQDFPGTGIFKKKIQDFPGGVGTLIKVKGAFEGDTGDEMFLGDHDAYDGTAVDGEGLEELRSLA